MSDAEVFAILTPRQRQVMQLARRGHDAREISERLGCSRQTVYVASSTARKRIQDAARPPAPPVELPPPVPVGDDASVCQFGHQKVPGRGCLGCSRAAKELHAPVEAAARVARELEQGKRCTHRMWSGRPCGLLLPCVHA